jgi:hypothetical protein
MKVGLGLSFIKGTIDGSFYMSLFDNYIKYHPYSFRKKHTTKAWDEKKHKKIIASLSKEDSFGVMSKNNDLFSSNDTGSKNPHKSVSIIQDREIFFPSNDEIETIISNESFIVAYLYDEDYEVVQNTAYSDNYSHRNYPAYILNSLKDTPYHINEFNEKQYDVKNNPGKMDLIGYCWLMAAYKMWFGKPFFEIVPKEKILSFTDAYEIKELADGKIFVQLFEKIEESASAVNMEKQRKWRKWLEFEKLIETYK